LEGAMKDYRIKITVRNDRILSKIESEYVSVRNFCMAMNLEYQRITDLIRGTSPINAKGEIKELVKKLMEALGCTIEELFTEKQLKGFVSHNKFETKVEEKDLIKIKQDVKPLELGMMEKDVKDVLSKIFNKFLTPREEKIIKMRFGIGMDTDYTLEEVGLQFLISKERVRHITERVIKKLSSPEVINELRNAGIQDIFSKVDIKGPLIKKREEKRLQKINVFKQMLKEDKENYEINELYKYKNISIDNETYNIITELQTVMSSESKLSRSQIIKTLVEEKERNIN
jgi:RNA polymerase sigma factor (sigma-70 family)